METQEKQYVIKYIKNKLSNKNERYKKLYKNAVRQYKFLVNGADTRKLLPTVDKNNRTFQLNLIEFCHGLTSEFEKEGINYFLPYGNLLGAVRNQMFIPWDDDFDIELLREDFNKLKDYCKNNFIEIPINESVHNDFHRCQLIDKYLKKYPNQTIYILYSDCLRIAKGESLEKSYHMDCLPLDYYNENCDIQEHWNYLTQVKDRFSTMEADKEVLEFLENEVKNNNNVLKNEISSKIYYGIDCWSSYDRYRAQNFFKTEDYLPAKRIKLENKEFWAPNNPERILELQYGDIYSFPENLCINRHLEKEKNSKEKSKEYKFDNKTSDEKKFILKRIKQKFFSDKDEYKKKYYKKYAEVKFLKKVIDIKTLKCGNAKLMHHQNEEFKFCKQIINILDNNAIQYALCGGSLIGAIRHNDYIPWDDDFDVVMMRKDYTKFLQYAKENFIEIPPLKNFDRLYQFETMNKYMEKYPNQTIFMRAPHWLRVLTGTNLLDSKFFEIFVLDYFKDEYTIEEHKKYLEKIKLHKLKIKNHKDMIDFYEYERKNNSNIVESSSKIYYGLDSLGSYVINPEKFMSYDMIFPLKKLKFRDMELSVPNDYDAYIKIQYKDYSSFPLQLSIAPCLKEKEAKYKEIKKIR